MANDGGRRGTGQRGIKGRRKLGNCNSIINKICLKKTHNIDKGLVSNSGYIGHRERAGSVLRKVNREQVSSVVWVWTLSNRL